jgi:hypothetical protein
VHQSWYGQWLPPWLSFAGRTSGLVLYKFIDQVLHFLRGQFFDEMVLPFS